MNSVNDINWLEPMQIPLANKFIRQHGFRGRVRSDDQCIVMRNQKEGIIALAVLRSFGEQDFLTAVSVAPDYQGQGLAKQLLSNMSSRFATNTYTFSLNHLVELYAYYGFQMVTEDDLPDEIRSRFVAYRKQGRQITAMVYSLEE